MYIIAFLFPYVTFLIRGKYLYALISFLLQMSVIGWFPAAIWGVISQRNYYRERHLKDLERILKNVINDKK